MGIMADAAFVCTADEWEFFVCWMTASRQAVEWGMRGLQSRWTRLLVPLSNDAVDRADLLELIVRLHNLVTHRIGANQSRSVYMVAAQELMLQM